MLRTSFIGSLLVSFGAPLLLTCYAGIGSSVTIKSDTDRRGGQIELESLTEIGSSNSLMKHLLIPDLEGVTSAELLICGALRDQTGETGFDEWVWFNLNGYAWVLLSEDIPVPRVQRETVAASDLAWSSISVPNVNYLKEGVNELVILNWKRKDPHGSGKHLVVAYDDSQRADGSFAPERGSVKWNVKWSNRDLNGEREGHPTGEWMIRLKLNRADKKPAEVVEQQSAEEQEFNWGFTHTASLVFPERSYDGPFENKWTLDAARNEYESCQLVVVPQSVDMLMTEVFVGDFAGSDETVIPASSATVRLVRTVHIPLPAASKRLGLLQHTANSQPLKWPDALPEAYPIDILRGQAQSYWITVHVPADAKPGTYTGSLVIRSMSTGGREGKPTRVPLTLRVRNFVLPTLSRYQMVGATPDLGKQYHIAHWLGGVQIRPKGVEITLDEQDNLHLDFEEFDRNMEKELARGGVREFSVGLAYTGAGGYAPDSFDFRAHPDGRVFLATDDPTGEPGQRNDTLRRVWMCPVDRENPDADTPEVQQARRYFTQYLGQIYRHLEAKDWTKYFSVYGADEPHPKEWTKPLTKYFALIKQIAPKLRIVITYSPTDRFGPNVDVACIMMNHLRSDTIQAARAHNQELWCYSCGHLNNPALTIAESDLRVRLWYWLQEKWQIERVLLWNTSVWGQTFRFPGVHSQGAGDGQIFYKRRRGSDGDQQFFPSIRAEMLRDGIEDREYIFLLKELTSQLAATAKTDAHRQLLRQAEQLASIPDELVKTQFAMTHDIDKLLSRRAQIADMVEQLRVALGENK